MIDVFSSMTEPIPSLRHDLELLPIQEDGEDLLLLRDPAGYAEEMLVFRPAAMALLQFFDGSRSISALLDAIQEETGVRIDGEQILSIVQSLDRFCFLSNERSRERQGEKDAAWQAQENRPAAHAGASYPDDPEELADFLQELFDADSSAVGDGTLLGVITPHIDLQIGPQVYVPAFRQLEHADVDTVVILGTSHYSYEDLFILTEKDFVTPLGTLPTDREFVRMLRAESGDLFTHRDVAHRQEHSIEFPVVFLQHLFGNSRVRIVPILCTSFEEFLVEGTRALADEKYAAFLKAFRSTVQKLGRKVTFVLSVDWSHIGRKFGDDFDAADLLDDVRESDHAQFTALEACDYDQFFHLLRESKNASKIDGFACITTFFDLVKPRRGVLLDYQQWHEEERASAVSFASMAFFSDEDETP
ncbi:MAG: AmmeMemoRadiSam system protein B [Bacteroidetes bacterium]|nr:AmmeMemoRadiSam system protein B [Bacteroidota bacterium]